MAGRSIGVFFLFGLGLIFLAIVFRLITEGVVSELYPTLYVASNGVDIIMILYNIIPFGLLIIGCLLLIVGGLSYRQQYGGNY